MVPFFCSFEKAINMFVLAAAATSAVSFEMKLSSQHFAKSQNNSTKTITKLSCRESVPNYCIVFLSCFISARLRLSISVRTRNEGRPQKPSGEKSGWEIGTEAGSNIL